MRAAAICKLRSITCTENSGTTLAAIASVFVLEDDFIFELDELDLVVSVTLESLDDRVQDEK